MSAERVRRPRAGYTLVEVLGATVITLLITGAALRSAVDSGTGTEMVRANLVLKAGDALRRVGNDLVRGDLDALPATGDRFAYQVPIDADGDGTVFDSHGSLEWGAIEKGIAVAGARTTVRFVTDFVVNEKALHCDLNGDGDQVDLFDVGHLERVRADGGIELVTGACVLQPAGNHGGDLDGDGVADPIFAVDATGAKTLATVSLTLVTKLSERVWIVERERKTVLCANDLP